MLIFAWPGYTRSGRSRRSCDFCVRRVVALVIGLVLLLGDHPVRGAVFLGAGVVATVVSMLSRRPGSWRTESEASTVLFEGHLVVQWVSTASVQDSAKARHMAGQLAMDVVARHQPSDVVLVLIETCPLWTREESATRDSAGRGSPGIRAGRRHCAGRGLNFAPDRWGPCAAGIPMIPRSETAAAR